MPVNSQPLLSVVVPFYGVGAYFRECLESIAAQTYSNLQVVLVDDESPDDCIDIAREFVARDGRFEVVRQANAGPGPARNNGIAHAQGQFLAFVDGDDIVPERAYELMMRSITRTGSSIVMGNARRFSRTSGVRQSWAHGRMCAKDQRATHILERPNLAYDRMLWNKVYRKGFYDEYGYSFPAIKYEDWPVALQSHLDALTVDVLNAPVYYWRERESGDSITQQLFRYENLLDRVVSAEMIFDLLERDASSVVRAAAHQHLLEVDMVAIAQAFAVAEDDDIDRLLALSKRFVDRLAPPRPGEARFNQLQYHALRSGDVALLRDLARFRDDGGLVGGARAHRDRLKRWRWNLDYPRRPRSSVPSSLYALPFTALRLQTLVTDVAWGDERLVMSATAQISHLTASAQDDVKVSLVNGIDRIPLPVTMYETLDAFKSWSPIGLRFEVDLAAVRQLDGLVWPLRFEVTRTSQGVTRTSMLTGAGPGAPHYPQGTFFSPDQYLQPGLTAGNVFCVHRVAFPTVVDEISAHDGAFRIVGTTSEPARRAHLVVSRPDGEVTFPAETAAASDGGTRFTIDVDAQELVSEDSPDDPFLHTATRKLLLRTEFGDMDLTWSSYERDAVVARDAERVTITRSRFGGAALTFGPTVPTLRSAVVEDDVVTLRGSHFGLAVLSGLSWRKYLPDSDDHVDVEAVARCEEDDFVISTALRDLIPDEDLPTQPGAPAADHTLFFTADGYNTPVGIEPAGLQDLPVERLVDGRIVLVTSVAGGVRVQVR